MLLAKRRPPNLERLADKRLGFDITPLVAEIACKVVVGRRRAGMLFTVSSPLNLERLAQ